MKKLLILTLGAATIFSCNKENGQTDLNNASASLYMAVKQSNTTKSISDPGTTGGIKSLFVQVLNSAGTLVGTELTFDAAALDKLSGTIGTSADQIIVEQIDQSAQDVLVYGFRSTTKPAGFVLSDYNGTKNINELQGVAFADIPYVSLTEGAATKNAIVKTTDPGVAGHTPHVVWKVSPTVSPYFARFEIGGNPITSSFSQVEVLNVYLNNFAPTYGVAPVKYEGNQAYFTYNDLGQITGTTGGDGVANPGDWKADYYTNANNMHGAPATSPKVQAFNLYAQDGTPQLILKVRVTPKANEGEPYIGYVTISGFTAGGTPISGIETGNVYQLDLSAFEVNKVNPYPNYEAPDLYMTITVTDWTLITIVPE